MQTLLQGFERKGIKELSRLISLIEENGVEGITLYSYLLPSIGRALRIGITGPPGAGKSSIINLLAQIFLKQGKKVGVLAVDPSSPFSGGALLGDRLRMADAVKQGAFVRSIATRGAKGGLSQTTLLSVDVLDAFGMDVIFVESVGVGQAELEIRFVCDTVCVVLVPESGDAIQAMKAGLMEIGDIFCINKMDRPGAEEIKMEVENILKLGESTAQKNWEAPLILVSALKEKGIEELKVQLEEHNKFLVNNEILKERQSARLTHFLDERLKENFWNEIKKKTDIDEKIKEFVKDCMNEKRIFKEVYEELRRKTLKFF